MPLSPSHHPKPEPWPKIRASIKYPILKPFYYSEWCGDHLAHWLSRWSLLAVLEYLSTLSILVVIISYALEAPQRTQQRHFQAWQVINTASKGGSGGRVEALQNLNDDHVPLVGVDLSGAFLEKISLPNADLRRSDLTAADLLGSTLTGANLSYSPLPNANLRESKLMRLNISHCNLQDADLGESNLQGAVIVKTNLQNADLSDSILTDVDISYSNLARADLRRADLKNLQFWRSISHIELANIAGVKNPPEGFTDWALAHGAVSITDDDAWTQLLDKPAATAPAK